MTERRIALDLGMPSPQPGFEAPAGAGGQPQADARGEQGLAGDARQLRALLEAGRAGAGATPGAAPAGAVPRPFDLFGTPVRAAVPAPAEPVTQPPGGAVDGLGDALSQMAQRLLVGDGSSGRRAVQLQLADGALPGTVVDVFEEEGAVVARFTCSQESARERLVRNADWLAASLAARLQRDVRVEVLADDPEDPCRIEARAGADAAPPASGLPR